MLKFLQSKFNVKQYTFSSLTKFLIISLFAAILKNVFHPSNADFGSGYAGQPQQETSFVEFEIDEEDFERNGAANQRNPTASTFLPISLLTMLLAFKLA